MPQAISETQVRHNAQKISGAVPTDTCTLLKHIHESCVAPASADHAKEKDVRRSLMNGLFSHTYVLDTHPTEQA